MSDDKTKRGPQDSKLINTSEDYEVAYWTDELGCTAEELKTAVAEVGSSAEAVRRHLKR